MGYIQEEVMNMAERQYYLSEEVKGKEYGKRPVVSTAESSDSEG